MIGIQQVRERKLFGFWVRHPFARAGNIWGPADEPDVGMLISFRVKPQDHLIRWQRWAEKKPVESRMGYLHEGHIAPDRNSLGHLDESQWEIGQDNKPRDPWQPSETIPFIADDGEEFLFATGSWGGHCALVKLEKAYWLDGGQRDPVVELGTEKHRNQYGGVNPRPVFTLVGWMTAAPTAPAALPPKKPASSDVIGEPGFDPSNPDDSFPF
jgi:hypothetical protein